jgi:predicted nucleic acid-binding protein
VSSTTRSSVIVQLVAGPTSSDHGDRLAARVRGDEERQRLDTALGLFRTHAVNGEIDRAGGLLKLGRGPSRGVGLADALIAATVQAHGLVPVTYNRKHFPMLDDVIKPY